MKRGGLVLLGVSLAANFVLWVWRPVSPSIRAGAGTDPSRGGGLESTTGVVERAAVDAAAPTPRVISSWEAIESGDLAVVRDRLRAAGFPEEYVRAIIWERIQRAHAADRLALVQGLGVRPFWEPIDRVAAQARADAERDLDRAMREEFNDYFDEPMGEVARARRARERLAFLPGDKAVEVTRIDTDYAELKRQVRGDVFSGIQLDEDQQKLALLEQERLADLAKVLTPEELELYELHTSQTAESMRSQLVLFEPSEAEFRAIHALQRDFDAEFGTYFGQSSREAMTRRSEAQEALERQIEGVLGPERYADYKRANDTGYQSALKITDHFNLPRENAAAVFALNQEYRQRAEDAMRSGADREQLAALARSLAAEASARVTELLGETGAKVFRETGGNWLRNLEQQAQRASAAPRP